MRIIGFVEGAFPSKGGFGLVGVPTILASIAARGHHIALVVAGAATPGRERFVVSDLEHALARKEGSGTFGIVSFKAWRVWAFAPAIAWRASRYVRNADFVSLHSVYAFPVLVGFLLARLHGKPYGVWPHGVLGLVQRRVGVGTKRVYDAVLTRRLLQGASVLFYSAKREQEEAVSLGLTPPSVIIPDGIDAGEFANLPPRGQFREKYCSGYSGDLVIFLARLTAKKGIDLLIKAMTRVMAERPGTRLAIIGAPDPPAFMDRVHKWVQQSDLDSQIVITGPIVPSEKLQALADADVFVLPSEAENFGFSIFEAMASGVPVVVSDTLDYAGEIARAGAGLSVPREPDCFSKAICRLLDDPVLRAEMGGHGKTLAQAYSLERTGADLERTIESLVTCRPLPSDLTGQTAY
jgi:glycosyltransferase involved in cell wall biosynthesis